MEDRVATIRRLYVVTGNTHNSFGLTADDQRRLATLRSVVPNTIYHSFRGAGERHEKMADLFETKRAIVRHTSEIFGEIDESPAKLPNERRVSLNDLILTLVNHDSVWYTDPEYLAALQWPDIKPFSVYRLDISEQSLEVYVYALAENGTILNNPQSRFKYKMILYPKGGPAGAAKGL